MLLIELHKLSEKLTLAAANTKAAIYYVEAAEKAEKLGNRKEVERLSSEAARHIQKCFELEFDKGHFLELCGDLYWKAGQQGFARVSYHGAYKLQPGDQKLIKKLVEATTQDYFDPDSSVDQRPYSIHILRARNALVYGLDNKDELVERAVTEVKLFLESENDDPDALLELSWLLKDTGDLDGAISCYERVLKVDPENHHAIRFLVYAYADKGWSDKAQDILHEAPDELGGFHPRVNNPDVWRARHLYLKPVGTRARVRNMSILPVSDTVTSFWKFICLLPPRGTDQYEYSLTPKTEPPPQSASLYELVNITLAFLK